MFASKFWEAAASGVAEKWLDRLFSPALAFLMVGSVAYALDHGTDHLLERLTKLTALEQAILIIATLASVAASTLAMQRASFSILRWLEGYLPPALLWARPLWMARAKKEFARIDAEWKKLAKTYETHSPEQRRRYTRLDGQRQLFPEDHSRLMPTKIGNALVGSENYVQRRYGLSAPLLWPRLWLHLSPETRSEIGSAQGRLLRSVELVAWSFALSAFVLWVWWTPIAAALATSVAYRNCVSTAKTFADLVKAIFDLEHASLLSAMNWQIPDADGPVPRALGSAATTFIRRGDRPDEQPNKSQLATESTRHKVAALSVLAAAVAIGARWVATRPKV